MHLSCEGLSLKLCTLALESMRLQDELAIPSSTCHALKLFYTHALAGSTSRPRRDSQRLRATKCGERPAEPRCTSRSSTTHSWRKPARSWPLCAAGRLSWRSPSPAGALQRTVIPS